MERGLRERVAGLVMAEAVGKAVRLEKALAQKLVAKRGDVNGGVYGWVEGDFYSCVFIGNVFD